MPADLRALLFGNPFGDVYPPRPQPPPLVEDGRTVALRILQRYVTSLIFYAPGANRIPVAFQILPENFHLEAPDYTQDLLMPAVVIRPSRADYDSIGLTSYVEETTRDVYSPGTVLQWQAEYIETLNLEVWANKVPERRAIVAGLETAISPTEQMSGLRFKMPDYYNELVCFTLNRRENFDEEMSARGRRRVQVEIEMRFNIVALVNYVPMQPIIEVDTDIDSQGVPIYLQPPVAPLDPPQPPGAEFVQQPDASDNTTTPRYPLPPSWGQ